MTKQCFARMCFIREYTITSMRLKKEKWNKITISDEQRAYLHAFIDKGSWNEKLVAILTSWPDEPQHMVISQNSAGHLQIHTDWPSPLKNKGVFFVKRYPEPLPDSQDLSDYLACGDIHPNVLGMCQDNL